MKRACLFVLTIVMACGLCLVSCGDDDDGGNGSSGGTTVDCNGTKVKISDYPNCVTYLQKLGECCPKSEQYYLQAAQGVICAGGAQVDDACKAIVGNTMAMDAACNTLKSNAACQ